MQVWVNGDDPKNVGKIASMLEKATKEKASADFKAFVIVVSKESSDTMEMSLKSLAKANELQNVALTFVGPDHPGINSYKINLQPEMKNTIMFYVKKRVATKLVNLVANEEGMKKLAEGVASIAP